MKAHITDAVLDKHQSTNSLQNTAKYIRDTKLTGFGARVSNRSVSFIIETKDKLNKTRRKTIGRYPVMSVPEARAVALDRLRELKTTYRPHPALGTALESYLSAMSLKPSTIQDYKLTFNNYLKDWSSVAVDEINKEMVVVKYLSSCERSVSQANKAMRHLSALLNFCEIEDNPVTVLSQRRIRKRLKPKTGHLMANDLPRFYQGLSDVRDKSIRLYIEFLLLTGLRANEASRLKWMDISGDTVTLRDTKNGDEHIIPVTSRMGEIIKSLRGEGAGSNTYVFSYRGERLRNCRKSLKTACRHLDYCLTRHDLRRTFASLAAAAGNDYVLIKRALNHRINDITSDSRPTQSHCALYSRAWPV